MLQSNNKHSIEGKDLLMEVFLKFLDVLLYFSYSKNVQKIIYVEKISFFSQRVASFRWKMFKKNCHNR